MAAWLGQWPGKWLGVWIGSSELGGPAYADAGLVVQGQGLCTLDADTLDANPQPETGGGGSWQIPRRFVRRRIDDEESFLIAVLM